MHAGNTLYGTRAADHGQAATRELQMYKQLMQWAETNYATFGLAEFRQDGPGVIVWGNDVNTHQSQSDFKVYVFRRQ